MNDFARVLSDIITQERKKQTFNIKDLAFEAGITPGYLSNLKLDKRRPPGREKLNHLLAALRHFKVASTDIQRLMDAYDRTQSGQLDESKLLESLIEEYAEKGSLFERLQHGVQQKGIVRKKRRSGKTAPPQKESARLVRADRRSVILQKIELLKNAGEQEGLGGKIYITWGHHPADRELSNELGQLREAIRNFLWVDSPFQVIFLHTGGVTKDLHDIVNFLAQYIGTSNCYLYELSDARRYLPEYLIIEGFGFIDAKPASGGRYWIQSAICEKGQTPTSKNLSALLEYMEHLLKTDGSQKLPLVQTEASLEKYVVGPLTQKLVDAESQQLEKERFLIKPFLSGTYRPGDLIRRKLEVLDLPQEIIEPYVDKHCERVDVLQKRLTRGKERTIHKRDFLRRTFSPALEKCFRHDQESETLDTIEVELLKAQILGTLKALKKNQNFHCAFVEQEFAIQFELAGDTAFFLFSASESQGLLPLERSQVGAAAWTNHPEVISRLHAEFDAKWAEIPPEWRTDSQEGRRQVIDFIVTESILAMLKADTPPHTLWEFMCELAEAACYLDAEDFRKALYSREQLAREIVTVTECIPSNIMPVEIGPWAPTDSIRTHQGLLDHILKRVTHFHLISSRTGLQNYWRSKRFKTHLFPKKWVKQHFQFLSGLVLEGKLSIEIIDAPTKQLVDIEVIDREFVRFKKCDASDDGEGGIALQNAALAQELLEYINRHLSSHCPQQRQGAQNVTEWFEEQFGVAPETSG